VSSQPPRRKRQRLPHHDYAEPGAYFITVCTREHACLFGEIIDATVISTEFGRIVEQTWRELPDIVPTIHLDAFVLMPNHVHGIIFVRERTRRGLPEVLRIFKSWTSRRAGTSIWQRGYYEHVIRNDADLERIRAYIEVNPTMWDRDEENPARIKKL
jgi:putative transposase